MSAHGNAVKDRLLGMPHGTAQGRLRKMILFDLLRSGGKDTCFRCENKIEDVEDLSIEHKVPWQSVADPKRAFFDLTNISFSHLSCNSAASNTMKKKCPTGHEYDERNTYTNPDGERCCRICRQGSRRQFRSSHREQDTQNYKKTAGWVPSKKPMEV